MKRLNDRQQLIALQRTNINVQELTVAALLTSGTIPDTGMVYFDIRPSQRFETLEVRVTDVGLTVDDAVLLANARADANRSANIVGTPGDNLTVA